MGRIIIICYFLILAGFGVLAQKNKVSIVGSGLGYSNLEFVENKGQWDSRVKFRARLSTGAFYLQQNGFTVLMEDTSDLKRLRAAIHGESGVSGPVPAGAPDKASPSSGKAGVTLHSHVYNVVFSGSNEQPTILPEKALASYNNYFIGNDPAKWASNCKLYQGFLYKNIYDGIDLHYYADKGTLKYDLIVHPGADPSRIVMKYEGPDKLSLKKGQLQIKTSVGTVTEWIPQSYQVNPSARLNESERTPVDCEYVITGGNQVSFRVRNYSPDATLVIDPSEVFCSFTGSTSDNWGYTATYDGSGNAYAGGIVLDETDQGGINGNGFPASPGAFQTTFQGGDGSEGDGYNYDVGILKLSPDGVSRIFATYLGGPGDEQPHSLIVDNGGNLVVAGRTSSGSHFPMKNGGIFGPGGGFDIFITKFTADGTALIGSRVIGGAFDDGVNFSPKYVNGPLHNEVGAQSLRLNYGDDGRSEVTLDASNNIYLASCTQSTHGGAGSLFPTTPGVFQPNHLGANSDQDGVLIKTSADLSTILFSSFLGGSADDAAFVLSLNPSNNNIYVGGGTSSTDFPGTGSGSPLNAANQGGIDGFVSIVSNDGGTLIGSSYFGTSGTDMIYGLKFDNLGFPYIMGTTTGTWPKVPANVPFYQTGGKQFIGKLQPNLGSYIYSTVFGKSGGSFPDISPTAFLVDRCENVYVAGWGGGVDISDRYENSYTTGLSVTPDAIKSTTDGEDFYFFVLQKDAASQLYGSFFGQNKGNFGDHVDGGTSRYDKQGVIYEAICANCYGGAVFPTTPGVWATQNGTGTYGCNEAVVKIAFNFAGVAAALKATVNGRANDTSNCIPLTAFLQDTILNAKSYIWNFGDGSPPLDTTGAKVTHVYTSTGIYTVQLIAIDSNSCNVADTVYTHIIAQDNPASLGFTYFKGSCVAMDYTFVNQSAPPAGGPPFGINSFLWDFGDGQQVPSGPGNLTHSYQSAGSYTVKLILHDSNYCNSPDTLTKPLTITPFVRAIFSTPSGGCAPYTAQFTNNSIGGQQFSWNFGDGNSSSSSGNPTNLYSLPGIYTVTLTVIDSTTCNIISDTSLTITVSGKPTAAFTFSPQPPVINTPTTFYNESTGGVSYQWLFGDGSSTVKGTLDTVVHQYQKTDTFQACLVVNNQFGCPDTVCHPVAAIVHPLLDVPNAFTPGRFGQNGIVKVVGFGITQLTFRIYNRWGQMVFESNDPSIGWDGTFKGVVQPMDVYAYTVEASYFDGSHATKKGDITLLR